MTVLGLVIRSPETDVAKKVTSEHIMQMLEKVLTILISGGLSAFGGYGIGKNQKG